MVSLLKFYQDCKKFNKIKIDSRIAKISCIIVIAFAVIFLLIGLFMSCDHVGRILEKIPSETNLDCFTAKIGKMNFF